VAAEERGGGSEGIKVHGDWTIEIRNPDGSLVSRHEFENALTDAGPFALSYILGRRIVDIRWEIFLGAPNTAEGGLCDNGFAPTRCRITEPDSHPSPEVFRNLELVFPPFPPIPFDGTLKLVGSATAAHAGSIPAVMTLIQANLVDFGWSGISFTRKDLASPIPVAEGQIIQVSVLFSFS
jgi:hypothetical protein